jgi:hypothetical protein
MRASCRLLIAAVVVPVLLGALPASVRADARVARVRGVDGLWALDRTLLYHRAAGWSRIVAGRRAAARGVPARAVALAIGRDRAGRVVVTFSRWPSGGEPRYPRWWAYDVAADTARRLSIAATRPCFATAAAVWRSRLAFAERCWTKLETAPGQPVWALGSSAIVLAQGGRVRRADVGQFADAQIALRRRSLAAVLDQDDPLSVWRIADDGRWCPRELAIADAEYNRVAPIAIRRGAIAWGTYDRLAGHSDPRILHLRLSDVAASGRCARRPRVRVLDDRAPPRGMRAASLDEDALYYATVNAIYRRRLPSRRTARSRAPRTPRPAGPG